MSISFITLNLLYILYYCKSIKLLEIVSKNKKIKLKSLLLTQAKRNQMYIIVIVISL